MTLLFHGIRADRFVDPVCSGKQGGPSPARLATDDFDAQSNIRYDVYVNGVLNDILFGSGGPSIVYADFGENLIEVFATDTAGNTSAPASVTIFV
jgi:hypothetical protein